MNYTDRLERYWKQKHINEKKGKVNESVGGFKIAPQYKDIEWIRIP